MPGYIPYLLIVGLPSSVFGYLRYRAYVSLVKHIVDAEGSEGLRAMDHVTGPWRPTLKPVGKQLHTKDDPPEGQAR